MTDTPPKVYDLTAADEVAGRAVIDEAGPAKPPLRQINPLNYQLAAVLEVVKNNKPQDQVAVLVMALVGSMRQAFFQLGIRDRAQRRRVISKLMEDMEDRFKKFGSPDADFAALDEAVRVQTEALFAKMRAAEAAGPTPPVEGA